MALLCDSEKKAADTESYVSRDSRRMRDLVIPDWCQEQCSDQVQLIRTGETGHSD